MHQHWWKAGDRASLLRGKTWYSGVVVAIRDDGKVDLKIRYVDLAQVQRQATITVSASALRRP